MGHALERHRIEDFYKGAKALGFGEYRFRASEAALIHAYLVVLACTLLDVLRRRLLRYSIVKSLPSVGLLWSGCAKEQCISSYTKSKKQSYQSKPYYD